MERSRSLLVLALVPLLAACSADLDGFATAGAVQPAGWDNAANLGDLAPERDDAEASTGAAGEDSDPDAPASEDDPEAEATDTDWAMPPEFTDGLEVDGIVTCGFVVESFDMGFRYDGDVWELLPGSVQVPPRPEFAPCFIPSIELQVEWTAEPVLRFSMGNIDHILVPTDDPGLWFGHALPIERTPECQAALDAHGVSDGVNMTYTMTVAGSPT